MTDQHPITPPPELVQEWTDEIYGGPGVVAASDDICLAKLAAQWGADTELDACCKWTAANFGELPGQNLHLFRRPKPPSLKEQSLALINRIQSTREAWLVEELDVVRKALEQLDD